MLSQKMAQMWAEVAGPLFDEAYDEGGPSKDEIEEMRTDLEYEVRVVECVAQAYQDFVDDHKLDPEWNELSSDEQVEIVRIALEAGQYGTYRGGLPEENAIRRALGHI